MKCDLLIKNGFVIDGSGKPGFTADLAISQGKITDIAAGLDCQAARLIDASGLTVCPGFIDPHVHAELTVLSQSVFESFLRQGVTTLITGNCGHSLVNGSSEQIYAYMIQKGLISPPSVEILKAQIPAWQDFPAYLEIVKSKGLSLNMGFLLGHGTLRWQLMGNSKNKPSLKEEAKIIGLIHKGMEQGALGLSSGLTYSPGRYADTAELIKFAQVAGKYDGIYTSHLRSYLGIPAAVGEAITIGERANLRVQISHLTPTSPESFQIILSARERGLDIALDTIPQSSGHFRRKDRLFQYLTTQPFPPSPQTLQKLIKKLRFKEKLQIVNSGDPQLENRTLADLAGERQLEIAELLFTLLANSNSRLTFCEGGLRRADFPGDLYPDSVAYNPLVMVGSDTVSGEINDPLAWFELFRRGAFPIYIRLCRQKGVRLEEIIRRITSLPARQFRLTDRGLLAKGQAADLTIIDLDGYTYPSPEEIDYKNPRAMASGVKYTLVNGQTALDNGTLRVINAGQLLAGRGRLL